MAAAEMTATSPAVATPSATVPTTTSVPECDLRLAESHDHKKYDADRKSVL